MSEENMNNQQWKEYEVPAVADGEIIQLDELDDQIFAQKLIGDGYAIRPTGNIVYSPVEGNVEQIAPSRHAIYLSLSEDIKLLIHIGLDTVEMKGKGFETRLEKRMTVNVGDPLIRFDSKLIREEGYDPVIAVILLNGTGKALDLTVFPNEDAKAMETLAMKIQEKK